VKVRFNDPAVVDLEEIGDWIAQENPSRAASFIAELRKSAAALSTHPRRYPIVGRFKSGRIRKKLHHRYLIFYRVTDTDVQIIRVVHGSRDWAALVREAEQAAAD
jgi:toxin ParE1/3/4